MGLVIEFGVPLVRPKRGKRLAPCEVTIFPGVRYERHDRGIGSVPQDRVRDEAETPRFQEEA